jgi:hypothetical protein
MKKALAGVFVASLVSLMAVAATAQNPHIQVYFNGNPTYNTYNATGENCKSPGTPQELYVVLRNWNMFVGGVEFSIQYPVALFKLGETYVPNTLQIGSSDGPNGVAVAWNLPQNGFDDLLVLTAHAVWTSNCDCNAAPQPLVVRGRTYLNDGSLSPVAVRWPDFAEIPGIGMTSLVCPDVVATEETTWGGVKALYR